MSIRPTPPAPAPGAARAARVVVIRTDAVDSSWPCCLVTTSAAARSQETEPLDDHKSGGRSFHRLSRESENPASATDARTDASEPGHFSMGAIPRFGLAVPGEAVQRRVWKSASRGTSHCAGSSDGTSGMPGEVADSSRALGANTDPSVGKAANSRYRRPPPPTPDLRAPARGVTPADDRVQVPLDPGQMLRDLPPALDPLPSTPLPPAVQPGLSEDDGVATDPSIGEVITAVSGSLMAWASGFSEDTHS